ncbi:MAG TPA: response regulator transcription factor, partial [Rariglobus sp.]
MASPSVRRELRDVVLVEDNPVDRRLIQAVFHRSFAPARWREFENGRLALDACLTSPPELLLVDLHLPDLDGLEVVKILQQDGHLFQVIVLTSHPEDSLPHSLLDLNIHGYLDKTTMGADLSSAVNSVVDGRLYFSASRSPFPHRAHPRSSAAPELSDREREIARLVTHGFPSKHIAARLGLSVRTVENHRARIMMRLGLVNVADLVRWCMRHGMG